MRAAAHSLCSLPSPSAALQQCGFDPPILELAFRVAWHGVGGWEDNAPSCYPRFCTNAAALGATRGRGSLRCTLKYAQPKGRNATASPYYLVALRPFPLHEAHCSCSLCYPGTRVPPVISTTVLPVCIPVIKARQGPSGPLPSDTNIVCLGSLAVLLASSSYLVLVLYSFHSASLVAK